MLCELRPEVVEQRLDRAMVVTPRVRVCEQTHHYGLGTRHKGSGVVAQVTVAGEVVHVAIEPCGYPSVHEGCVIVQPTDGRESAGIKAYFAGEVTDICVCRRQVA